MTFIGADTIAICDVGGAVEIEQDALGLAFLARRWNWTEYLSTSRAVWQRFARLRIGSAFTAICLRSVSIDRYSLRATLARRAISQTLGQSRPNEGVAFWLRLAVAIDHRLLAIEAYPNALGHAEVIWIWALRGLTSRAGWIGQTLQCIGVTMAGEFRAGRIDGEIGEERHARRRIVDKDLALAAHGRYRAEAVATQRISNYLNAAAVTGRR
jgi:hypothetical protein